MKSEPFGPSYETVQKLGSPPDKQGWSGDTMILGKLPVPGRPTIWMIAGQGPTAVGAGGGCLDIFTLIYLPLFGRRPDIQ